MWEPEFLEHVIILIKYKRKIGDLLKMGVLDKFLSIMKLDDGDDEYDEDEFFDDDEYDDASAFKKKQCKYGGLRDQANFCRRFKRDYRDFIKWTYRYFES